MTDAANMASGAEPRLAIHAFTTEGLRLAQRVAARLPADIHAPASLCGGDGVRAFSSLPGHMEKMFHAFRQHLFIGATGIAVRAIAPFLLGKDADPAVVAMDQRGAHVISLIGGHMAGANRLAMSIAAITGGEAVISTATDTEGLPAIDALALDSRLAIADAARVKSVNAAILRGERVSLSDPEGRLDLQGYDDFFTHAPRPEDADVRVTWQAPPAGDGRLFLHPPVLFVGVGCRRNVPAAQILEAIRQVFAENGLAAASIAGIASVDRKADEAGLLEAVEKLGVPFSTYPAHQLEDTGALSFSQKAWEILGAPGVAEPAALCMAAERGAAMLLVPKTKHDSVTVAVARLGALWKDGQGGEPHQGGKHSG